MGGARPPSSEHRSFGLPARRPAETNVRARRARAGIAGRFPLARAATLLAFLGAAATSHAATLVSNLDKATNSKNPLNVRVAQQFETGDRTAGYKLDAVELGVERPSGSTRGIQVRLYSTDSSGRPDSRIFTFSGTTVPSGSNNVRFEAPGGTRLDPGTNYFIALRQSGGGGDNLQTRATDNSGQSGLDNWSIANGHYWYSGTSWHSADRAIKMKLLGENAADSPYVTDVAREAAPAGGTYEVGQPITVVVTFNETVDVAGAPRLPLDIGGTTRYATTAAATDTDTVHFDYAVQAADFDADGFEIAKNTLALNGGTIRRANTSVDADLDHPGVSANDEHAVNLILIEEVAMASEAPHGRIYTEGDDIDIGVTFNQPVDVTGTPQLAICVNRSGDDCNEKQADYDRGTGSETLVFRYTVQAGDEDNNGIFIDDDAVSLNGGAITLADDDSRAAILDHSRPGRQDNHRVNALAEIIGSGVAVTSSPRAAPQTYGVGERIEITVTFGAPVNATGSTDFVLSVAGARRAPLLRGSGTNQLVFGYTVQAGDDDDDGIWIGDQDRTLVGNRDGNPQNGAVTSVADATAAMLDHSLVGQLSGHRVDGGRTPPRLSVAGAVGDEGGDVVFTVTLTETIGDELTATWTASIESGDSAAAEDLGADTTGTVTVPADTTTATFAVATTDDATDEFDETFTVMLSDPSTAALAADPTATGTIRDDDAAPTVDIADAEATEGGDLEFGVTLSAESGKPVTWQGAVLLEPGDTASRADLGPAALDWTFAPGIVAATTTVATVDDDLDEDAETFTVRALVVTNATAGDGMATGTITDNDEPPALSVADGSGTEGSAVAFTVTLSAESGKDVAAEATTSVETGDTATSGTDFTALSRAAVSIPAGDRTATVSVAAATDTVADDGETFTLTLANPTNATVAKATATGTISELPTLSVADAAAVVEGGTAAFGVTLTTAASSTVTVDWAASGDTATVDEDFTAASGTLTFAVGVTAATTTVATLRDLLDEEDEETFTLTLSNAAPAGSVVLGDPTATGTITDDDDPPVLSVDDVTVGEGDPAVFAVMLTAPSGLPVTVDWATSVAAGDTAEEGVDFTAATSTLVFAPGRTTWTVEVATTADADSDDETFTLTLSELTNATFAGGAATLTATGTIADTPRLDVANVTVDEGGTATFEVTLSRAAPAAVTVDWALSDGTATAGVDFDAGSGTLTFAAGDTAMPVPVTTTPDELDEGDAETFTLTLSNAAPAGSVVLGDPTATGTITDDDDPPVLSVDDVTVGEGDPAVFAVMLTAPSGLPVTVHYATTVASGDSAETDDFTAATSTLVFAPGRTTWMVEVATTADADGDDETFTLTLSMPTNATFAGGAATLTATGTIADTPRLDVADVTVDEGGTARFEVTLSRAAPAAVTVDWALSDGTATVGVDFDAGSGTLTFAPGDTAMPVTVTTTSDDLDEGDAETFTLTLSNASSNVVLEGGGATQTASGTITDDDDPPVLSVDDVTVGEGDPAVFAVELSARSGLPVTVDWATTVESGDSAEADDLTPDSGTLTFTPGATRRTVTVATTLDADNEDETFTLTLSELANATFDGGGATLRATGTIADLPRLSVATGAATSAWEGDPVEIRFRLTRDAPSRVTVDWTAAAGPGDTVEVAEDLPQTSGQLVIAAGREQGTLTVPTNPDDDEADETFTVTLSNPSNATFAGGGAALTVPAKIADADRLAPIVTVDDVLPVESSRGGSVSDLQFRLLCPDCPTAREATQSNSDPVTGVWFDLVARPNDRLRVWQEPEDEAAGCEPIVDIPAGEIFAKATQLANFGHPDDPDRWSPRVLSLLVETDEPCNGRVYSYAFAAARYTLELAPWNRSLRAGPAWVVDTRGGIDEFKIESCPGDPGRLRGFRRHRRHGHGRRGHGWRGYGRRRIRVARIRVARIRAALVAARQAAAPVVARAAVRATGRRWRRTRSRPRCWSAAGP